MAKPYLTIDLGKIEHNARTIVRLCETHGIEVTGVTKATCGHPEVAKAMLRGGVASIGESRLENVARLKAAGVDTAYMLLRMPWLSGAEDIVEAVDLSLNSELSVLAALSEAARQNSQVHEVMVMVDLGDLREGVWPDRLAAMVRDLLRLPGIRLVGLGASLTCFSGVIPTESNMNQLVACAREIETTFGVTLPRISGGSSSALELLATGRMPKRINHLRIGEGILLGRETTHRRPWPGTFQDTFVLHAEVLELKRKPSVPIGQRGEDAFGQVPSIVDRGEVDRAIVNVGRQDVDVDGLTPVDPDLTILGASSGYVIVDATAAGGRYRVGDEMAFLVNYGALLAAMTSPYVEKRPLRGGGA
jgi:predicted amino acid racemase